MILSSGRISLLVADGADLQVSFAKTAVVQVIFQQQGSRSSSCCWSVLPALVPTSKLGVQGMLSLGPVVYCPHRKVSWRTTEIGILDAFISKLQIVLLL